ncbi:tyrosine--tRNA ligase [Paenibacillus eucommiae]|uniref:Tyrosine--tRNA ligase n=1 Tax=Paenibacillus eucommiae TaxID=1355755 RepID=A0ABS4IM97_9BACL|nr:tyrosyl-tRNA synthetase [Paenibacillus eucommiae]
MKIHWIIGDFTGRIGDPSGKSETRKQLTEEDVKRNAETYQKQLYKILNPEQTQFHYNSTWLGEMKFEAVLNLAGKLTVARMLERDAFAKRFANNQPIHIHEFFYPLMQAYDSVSLESDIELGGTDQTFNILMGRTLQGAWALPEHMEVIRILSNELDDSSTILLYSLLVKMKLQVSNAEARRSIIQGAVRINEQKITDPQAQIRPQQGDIVQVGKRKFARLEIEL